MAKSSIGTSTTTATKRDGDEVAGAAAEKRPRASVDIKSLTSNNLPSCNPEPQLSGFSFGFGSSTSDPEDDEYEIEAATHVRSCVKDSLEEEKQALFSSVECIALRDHWAAGMVGKVTKGTIYFIDWEKSSHFSLCLKDGHVDGVATGADLYAPPSAVRLLRSEMDHRKKSLRNDIVTNTSTLIHYDSTWIKPQVVTNSALLYTNTPAILEPGIESFVWPLSMDDFIENVYQKKALVVHGTGQRLEEIQKDFNELNVEEMVQDASRLVVWMKTKQGKMQYIDAGPDIAINCYRAGHTLYFNPSLEVQRKYFDVLTESLGMKCIDFGTNGDDDFGGDIEIFAVDRAHDTPWHFDAQENFTIQLKGTKRWSVCKSDLDDVVTNLHPDSTNLKAVLNDYKAHSGYTGRRPTPPIDGQDEVYTFVMRPGSILYAPGGMWHKVSCEDEDGGSLSMNFSVDGRRWADLLVSRLQPLLWKNAGWRSRIQEMEPSKARSKLNTLLTDLRETLGGLTADDFLPPAILENNTVRTDSGVIQKLYRIHGEIGEEDREMKQAITNGLAIRELYPSIGKSTFTRNPLCDITQEAILPIGERWSVHSGYSKDNLNSEYMKSLIIPCYMHDLMIFLMALPIYEAPKRPIEWISKGFDISTVMKRQGSQMEIEILLSVLVFVGFLHESTL